MSFHAFICNLFSPCDGKIVFYSRSGEYGGSAKYVMEELVRRKVSCKIIWLSDRNKVLTPHGIDSYCGTYRIYRELSTAHIIIADGRILQYWQRGYKKKPGQAYVQIEHIGSMGPSKIGGDIHCSESEHILACRIDSSQISFMLSGSKWETENCSSAFWLGKPALEWGHPCNDLLINPSGIGERVRAFLNISMDAKIVLYVSAARDWEGARSIADFNYDQILTALENRFGGEWVFLVHSQTQTMQKGKGQLMVYDESRVKNVIDYPNMTELLASADVIISDYTTYAFDYLLTRKPAFLYAPDANEYAEHHGLYCPLEEVPMPVSCDQQSLLESIEMFDMDAYINTVEHFLEERGCKEDGKASARLVDWIIKKALPNRPPSQSASRMRYMREILKKMKSTIWTTKRLNENFVQYKVLGFSFLSLAKPHPPKNPYVDLPIMHRKIVFRAAQRGFSCNPKYIVQEILRRRLTYDIVWVVSPADKNFLKYMYKFPSQIRIVVSDTEEAEKEIATAGIWVNSFERVADYRRGLIKRASQIYIQLWHGSFGIKANPIDSIRRKWSRLSEGQLDYLIANSKFEAEKVYCPMFGFGKNIKSKILMYGHPRNDLLISGISEQSKLEIRREIGVDANKKIVLYAPTWRDDWYQEWDTIDYKRLCKSLKQRFGGDWICAARLHQKLYPYHQGIDETNGSVVDVFHYPDIQELMLVSDAFISDYSSSICDYMLTHRPIFLFAPDYTRYTKKARGLLYPLEDTPCPIAANNDELENIILTFEDARYQRLLGKFLKKMGCIEDGHAAKRVVDLIETLVPVSK